jgi:conjugal transfer pilus assembly protein TraW
MRIVHEKKPRTRRGTNAANAFTEDTFTFTDPLVRSDSKDSAFRGIGVVRLCNGGYLDALGGRLPGACFFVYPLCPQRCQKLSQQKIMRPSILTVFLRAIRAIVRARPSCAAPQKKKPRTGQGFTAAAKVLTGERLTFAATQYREERLSTSFCNGNFRDRRRNDKESMPDEQKHVKEIGIIVFRGKAKPAVFLSGFTQKEKPRTRRGITDTAKDCSLTFAAALRTNHKDSASRCSDGDADGRTMPGAENFVNTRKKRRVQASQEHNFYGRFSPARLHVAHTALKKILCLRDVPQTVFLQMARAVACTLLLYADIAPDFAFARVVGTEGNVYPIHEIELTKLIAAKAGEFDFERYAESNKRQMEDRVRSFRPVDAVSDLPIANISAAYKIDPTYTLPYDIRDAQGEIVYPQGYTFNPLEAMSRQGLSIRTPYVIINAERLEEMRWLERKVGKSARGTFVLLITNGHAYELSERFGFPVYYLSEQVRERLAIRVTPTVIFQPQNERKFLFANIFRLDSDGRELIPKRR